MGTAAARNGASTYQITANTSLSSGGGIVNVFPGVLTLVLSRVTGNIATADGGIDNEAGAILRVFLSLISGNTPPP